MKNMRMAAALTLAGPIAFLPTAAADAATYVTSYTCSGYGGSTWFKVWSGRVQTSGAHAGYWPLYGQMSGYVHDDNRFTNFTPKQMILGGASKPVSGVQTTWVKKGYVTASSARWSAWWYAPAPHALSDVGCTTGTVKAVG